MTPLTLNVVSFNVMGFKKSKPFLRSYLDKSTNTILAIQEHWLLPSYKKNSGVNALKNVHDDFDGWGFSAMNDAIRTDVRLGRPYGGTGFVFDKSLSLALKPCISHKYPRVTAIELNTLNSHVLLINAYMPFLNTSNVDDCKSDYFETLSQIQSIIRDFPESEFIICMDMNCNVYNISHPFTQMLTDFISKNNFVTALDLNDTIDLSTAWSRHDFKKHNPSRTLIDGIVVSKRLIPLIESIDIGHYGDNRSDHCPVEMRIKFDLITFEPKKRDNFHDVINWRLVTGDVKEKYERHMDELLSKVAVNVGELFHGSHLCSDHSHIHLIEKYYTDLIDVLEKCDRLLPRKNPYCYNEFWNDELSDLKQSSISAAKLWNELGKPHDGPIYENKRKAHYSYKYALRRFRNSVDQERLDGIHSNLVDNRVNKFWSSWKSLKGNVNGDVTRINGYVDKGKIADEFASAFHKVYTSNSVTASQRLSSLFSQRYLPYCNERLNESITDYLFTWDDMMKVVEKLKLNKSTATFLKAEHILNGSPQLIVHFQLLFNTMLQHSYVPMELLNGVISPLVKNQDGDLTDTANYRGITLSPVVSYMFEHALLLKFGRWLLSDDMQFGYKPKHSTTHAIFALKSCINYFCDNGSNVFAAFLDCTKGFDKIDHNGIFIKLMNRGIPLCFLNLLIYWYSNMHVKCKWKDTFSGSFKVTSGVKQGGVLSPHLFAVYLDELMILLRKSGCGCYIVDLFVEAILYADDLALIAPTRSSLQTLIDICTEYGTTWCIDYNFKKTKIMIFGKRHTELMQTSFSLLDQPIAVVDSWNYLGVALISGKSFLCSCDEELSSFYRSVNSVLNVQGKPSDDIMMRILYTVCVPTLLYACEAKDPRPGDLTRLNTAVNKAIRKIFGFSYWQGVREMRSLFEYESVTEIFAKRRSNFLQRLPSLNNDFITELLKHFHDL